MRPICTVMLYSFKLYVLYTVYPAIGSVLGEGVGALGANSKGGRRLFEAGR